MVELSTSKLQMTHNKISKLDVLEFDTVVITKDEILKQEKEYQRLISEKLKSAVDWHLRDSKSFSLS